MSALKEVMNTANKSFVWQVLREEIVIEHKLNLEFTKYELTLLSQELLSLFCLQPHLSGELLLSFAEDVLGDIPKEGGALPIDNIIDWIEYKELTSILIFERGGVGQSDVVSFR